MEEEPMARLGRKRAIVAALVLSVALGMAGPAAAEDDEHRFAKDFGYGVGAFFTNLFYMPVKFVYATLGGITGGFAYVLTGFNYDIAKGIWVPSMGGDLRGHALDAAWRGSHLFQRHHAAEEDVGRPRRGRPRYDR